MVSTALSAPAGKADPGADAVERLAHVLAVRGEILLLLDNFEQVVDCAAATVGEWLQRCPNVSFLVTSRTRLRTEGENVIPPGPLGLENAVDEPSEAVTLLLDRVRRLRHDVDLSSHEEVLLDIVRQLDGIPLAIELAAPRIAFLGAKTLLELLDQRFAILTSPSRTASKKGSALRDALDWSWALLEPYERSALMQCSAFRGGFDLEAARAVVTLDDDAPPLLDVLQSLHEHSLLSSERADGAPDARFNLLLSIRDYGAEQLAAAGDPEAVAARHAHHYARAGLSHARDASGPSWRTAMRWLEREKENLKAAASSRAATADDALMAAIALEPSMSLEGPLAEYLAVLDRALERAEDGSPALRVEARLMRGMVRRQVGMLDPARLDLERARSEATSPALEGRAVTGLAMVCLAQGELPAAAALFEEAIALLSRSDDRVHEALARASYGAVCAGRGDLEGARACLETALSLHTNAGNLREAGMVTAFLGNLSIDAGAYEDARVLFAQAEAIHDEVGNRFGQAFTAANLAVLLHRQDAIEAALPRYEGALTQFRELGARRYVGAFEGYYALALEEVGRTEEARSRLVDACAVLTAVRDERFRALFEAHLARLAASSDLELARAHLASARRGIEMTDDPHLRLAIELSGSVVESRDGGEPPSVWIRRATEPAENGRAPIDESADVAFAVRGVARATIGVRSSEETPVAPTRITPGVLVISTDGAFLQLPTGERVSLGRRTSLHRLLVALARQRHEHVGLPLPREALIAAAWPGERMLREAGMNRLRVAVATLRRVGLRDLLMTHPDGYLLDPAIPLEMPEPRH